MSRVCAVVAMLVCASESFAADIPKGTWKKSHVSGASWTVTLDGRGATWIGKTSTGDTTTIIAPACRTEEDGIAFGYVKQVLRVSGEFKSDHNDIYPYGFGFSVKDESLTIMSFSMIGFGPQIGQELSGKYMRVRDEEPAKTTAEPSKVQR